MGSEITVTSNFSVSGHNYEGEILRDQLSIIEWRWKWLSQLCTQFKQ